MITLGRGGAPVPLPGDIPGVAFKPAKFFRFWSRPAFLGVKKGNVWIVLHTAECAETKTAAEALQSYAATMADGRIASWSYACDADSTTQSVLEKYVAFHAPPLNDYSIGIELAGYSNQLVSGWDDEYSRQMLNGQLVPLLINICGRTGIPARTVPDDLLRQGLEQCAPTHQYEPTRDTYGGILTHAQVARVFKKSTHHDPGTSFPLDNIITQVVGGLASGV